MSDEEVVERVDKVVAYRQEILERNGYEPADALRLASDRDVDLHRAVDLVRAGCSHRMAVEILA